MEDSQGLKSAPANPGLSTAREERAQRLVKILCVFSGFVIKEGLMTARNLQKLEADFFRSLNQFVEPLVRAGLGSPLPWTTGAIVLETRGRKTGRPLSVPLLATLAGDFLLVSTVRKRSQWVKNLAAKGDVSYWIYGRQRRATAFVFAAGLESPPVTDMPVAAACLAGAILPQSRLFGVSFAILVPQAD
jgi:hypothetical protein